LLTVGGQLQIVQEFVGQGLCKVGPIEFETNKHNAGKDHDPKINPPHQFIFFSPCPLPYQYVMNVDSSTVPSKIWVKPMKVLP
jgi:hypothetical protein